MPAARPSWVVQPLDIKEAALALGVSLRTLQEFLKGRDTFEQRGNRKVFYPEHIATLRRDMHECASRSNGSKVGPTPTEPRLMVNASAALSELRTIEKQRKQGRT